METPDARTVGAAISDKGLANEGSDTSRPMGSCAPDAGKSSPTRRPRSDKGKPRGSYKAKAQAEAREGWTPSAPVKREEETREG